MTTATRPTTDWFLTYSGTRCYPHDPRVEDICIEDIAHALSMLCRYTGQCARFYSVAEHSILTSLMVPPELSLEALLHDATEAYLGDMSRPVKRGLPEYTLLERLHHAAICERFRLPFHEHPLVKRADNDILQTEFRTLFRPLDDYSEVPGTFDPTVRLFCWPPAHAEIAFLNRYRALVKASGIRNS
jgi:hypothetical protein